jgi:hypothetical protein
MVRGQAEGPSKPTKVVGSSQATKRIQTGVVTLTLALFSMRQIYCNSKRGIRRRELHWPYLKTSRGEYQLNNAKANRILTFPSSLQFLTINIDQGEEEWVVPRSSGRRDLPRTSRRHPVKHQEVSFRCDGKQCKQNTHLPLIFRARYC